MKILIVVSDLPFPPDSGAAIRNHEFLRHLAAGHHVTVLGYAGGDAEARRRAARAVGAEAVTVALPRRRKRLEQLLSVGSSRSHLGRIFHSPALQAAISHEEARLRPDVVLVEGSLLMRHRFSPAAKLVLDEHNLEFEALSRTARNERSPVRALFNRLEAAKFAREERAAWRRADLCVFTSEREAGLMRALDPLTPAVVVGNGVDLDYFRPRPVAVDPDSVVFTGRIDYRPNADAVTYLVREIMPAVWQQRPAVRLTVVGAGVPAAVQRLQGPRVTITGRVPDVRPYVERAAVMVAPIRIGSGTRLKVLEALAAGKAMVSTGLGCEGIDVRPGVHLLVADEPAAFARSILTVLENPSLATELGHAGRHLVESAYGWPALATRLEDALLELAAEAGEPNLRPAFSAS